ncbi:MAG: OmpA family protein [bacterium]|nr:OmpA family protein [bacterium]
MKKFMIGSKLVILAASVAILLASNSSGVIADELTKEGMIKSLRMLKTRAFDPGRTKRMIKFRSFVNTLRKKKTRQITVQERTKVAKFVRTNKLPSIDLEVYFDYNSAKLSPGAMTKLTVLGEALSDKRLKGKTFLIGGHTDAKGGDTYNQSLSEKRANAVKEHLAKSFSLESSSLVSIGYGEEQLKSPGAPEDSKNRRVQVATLGE